MTMRLFRFVTLGAALLLAAAPIGAQSATGSPTRPTARPAPDPTAGFVSKPLPPPDSVGATPPAPKPVTTPAPVAPTRPSGTDSAVARRTLKQSTANDGIDNERNARPDVHPNGATARCKDGTYLFTPPQNGMCDAHRGLLVTFPPPATPPPPPRRP